MASNYASFPVTYRDTEGIIQSVGAGISVKVRVRDAGADVAESPLTTDSNGVIAAGSLAAVAVGSVVCFRVENYGGRAFSVAQITT